MSADRAGVLTSIKHGEGADVKVGEVLAVLDDSAGAAATPRVSTGKAAAPAAAKPQPAATGRAAACRVRTCAPRQPRATSRARPGVKLESVAASGPSGRVTKDDVLKRAAQPPAPAAPPAPHQRRSSAPVAPAAPSTGERREERVRMSKRRATIARRLVEAQHTAAMLTTFNEVDMTAVMGLRERRKESFQKQYGVGLGIASFFVKAAIGALHAFPQLNAEIQGDEIVLKHYYDIGMAVGAEGGLVVPVIRDADRDRSPRSSWRSATSRSARRTER